jgi:hypothetical protein
MNLTKIKPNPNPSSTTSKRFGHLTSVLAMDDQGCLRECWEDQAGKLYAGPVVSWDQKNLSKFDANQKVRDAAVVAARDEMLALRAVREKRSKGKDLEQADINLLGDMMLKRMGI